MKRVFGWVLFALVIATLFSVGGAMWRSMDFDSKFSGYVQNAVRVPPVEMERRIHEIAGEVGITIEPGSLVIMTQKGGGYEVSCRYPIHLGIGGFVYVWNKEVIARTRLSGLAGYANPGPVIS